MKTSKLDKIIQDSVEQHVEECIRRKENGFRVLEVEVPLEISSKVFTLLNDELSFGKRMYGWEFGIFSTGQFEGKMAQTFTDNDRVFKRYFLKYTL
jgi:hypothetical protein